jgi:hypothetical protein
MLFSQGEFMHKGQMSIRGSPAVFSIEVMRGKKGHRIGSFIKQIGHHLNL